MTIIVHFEPINFQKLEEEMLTLLIEYNLYEIKIKMEWNHHLNFGLSPSELVLTGAIQDTVHYMI